MKEAYTKGRGDGIAFHLGNCDFTIDEARSSATVAVEGRPLPEWKFYLQALPDDHWISVGRGPPTDAIDANGGFKATFESPSLPQRGAPLLTAAWPEGPRGPHLSRDRVRHAVAQPHRRGEVTHRARATFVFADLATHLARPEPPFVPKRIAELVPEPLRAKHAEAATSGVVLNDQNSSRRA